MKEKSTIRTATSLCLVAIAGLVLGQPAAAQVVVDGDTIELKGSTFRLHGIDAPELSQVYITEEDATVFARRGVAGSYPPPFLLSPHAITLLPISWPNLCAPKVANQDDRRPLQ